MTTQTRTLNDLLQLNGVVAVHEFGADGRLVDYKASLPMSPELAELSAQFCSSVTGLFNTLGGAFTKLSGMPWSPQQGWAYTGGQYTVCVAGRRAVFVESAKADFNQLFGVLIGR